MGFDFNNAQLNNDQSIISEEFLIKYYIDKLIKLLNIRNIRPCDLEIYNKNNVYYIDHIESVDNKYITNSENFNNFLIKLYVWYNCNTEVLTKLNLKLYCPTILFYSIEEQRKKFNNEYLLTKNNRESFTNWVAQFIIMLKR